MIPAFRVRLPHIDFDGNRKTETTQVFTVSIRTFSGSFWISFCREATFFLSFSCSVLMSSEDLHAHAIVRNQLTTAPATRNPKHLRGANCTHSHTPPFNLYPLPHGLSTPKNALRLRRLLLHLLSLLVQHGDPLGHLNDAHAVSTRSTRTRANFCLHLTRLRTFLLYAASLAAHFILSSSICWYCCIKPLTCGKDTRFRTQTLCTMVSSENGHA